MKKLLIGTIIACMLFSMTACSSSTAKKDSKEDKELSEIMTTNDTKIKITEDDFNKEFETAKLSYITQYGQDQWDKAESDAATLEVIKQNVLNTMILEDIMEDEVKKLKLTVKDEDVNAQYEQYKKNFDTEEALKEDLAKYNLTEETAKESIRKDLIKDAFLQYKADLINKIEPTEDQLKELYNDNKSKYNQIQASHILVDTEEKAREIKKKLDEGGDFATLAKENSTCPSASNGGDLGLFSATEMDEDFSKVAFSLPVNEISEPVKTQFGWHIIKVTKKITKYSEVDQDTLKNDYRYGIFSDMVENYTKNANVELPASLKTIRDAYLKETTEK